MPSTAVSSVPAWACRVKFDVRIDRPAADRALADEAELRTLPRPRVLWIELTSRCPFDCVFCTRKSLRGAGRHMDIALFRRLIGQLDRPQILRLNYAGESGHYPDLAEAVALAAATGAQVELVTALASLKPDRLQALLAAGLSRLTVSLHSLDAEGFAAIYRFSDLASLRARLAEVVAWRDTHPDFVLDLAFVAMRRNLAELPAIAALAEALRIPVLAVHPLIARDPLPMGSDGEHGVDGSLAAGFARELTEVVAAATALAPSVALQLSSHELDPPRELGARAQPWPWTLPPAARLVECDQSPFATTHVLSDGRVVACEVLEKLTLGELRTQSLAEVWQGEAYRALRVEHLAGRQPGCRECIYKRACRATPSAAQVRRDDIPGHQLLHGWHPDDGETLWSQREAALLLGPRPGARQLRLRGQLAAVAGFELRWRGALLHRSDGRDRAIDLVLRLPAAEPASAGLLEIHCPAAPAARPPGADQRELGFALFEAALR